MLSSLQQKAVWEGWLSGEIRANYFADLAGRYQRNQRIITWAMLAFSSGAFATLVSDWLPARFLWIRPVTVFVIAALSFWSLTAKNERNAIECSDLHFKWNILAGKYERLWDDMYSESAPKALQDLQEKGAEISKGCVGLPNKGKLMLRWEKHVILHHGAQMPE